jgi:hypothetical protein
MASSEARAGRGSGSAADFFGLFRTGDLAVRYPEVPALLAGLDGPETSGLTRSRRSRHCRRHEAAGDGWS